MPSPTYKQWILPKIPMWYGLAEVRINHRSYQPFADPIPTPNFDFYQSDQTAVVVLSDRYRMLKSRGMTPLKKHISRVEGQLTPDARIFQFTDYFQYSGTLASDGSTVSEDLKTTAYKSLNYRIFDDPLSVYTIFLSRCKKANAGAYDAGTAYATGDIVSYNNDTWELGKDAPATLTGQTPGGSSGYAEDQTKWVKARELYFIGDIKFQNAAGQHILQHKPGTSNAEQLTALEVQADACANRLSSFKIRDFIQNISSSDLIGPTPIYGGYITRPNQKIENGLVYYDDLVRQRHTVTYPGGGTGSWYPRAGVAGTTSNDALHVILFSKMTEKIAETCYYEHDSTTDLTTSFVPYRDYFSQDPAGTWKSGCPVACDSIITELGTPFTYTGVCYEYLVGSDPRGDLNKIEMSSPVTLGWSASLADLAKRIAFQFGCYVRVEYDQALKKPRIRWIDRSEDSGRALPANWKPGKDSRIAPKAIAAKRVEIGYTGDSDRATTPVLDGEALNVELGWRTKAKGDMAGPTLDDLIYNTGMSQEQQYSCWRPMTGGMAYGGHIIADGATIANAPGPLAYLYTVTYSGMFTGYGGGLDSGNGADFSFKDGDPVAFSNGKYGTVSDNTNIFFDSLLVSMNDGLTASGSMDVAIGYLRYAKDGVVSTTTTDIITSSLVDFTDGAGDHAGSLIGQQFILPSIGVFTMIDAWTVTAGVWAAKLDRTIGTASAGLTFRIGGPQINSDGWHCGAYMLWYDSDVNASHFVNGPAGPAGGWESNLYHATNGDTSGAYTIGRWRYKGTRPSLDATYPDKSYGSALKSSLQFYGAQFLTTRSSLEKTFKGALADDGTITGYDVLDTFGEYIAGADRSFYSTGLELDDFSGLVKLTFEEVGLTENNVESYPILRPGSSGGSSGGASSVGSGWSGGGSSSGGTSSSTSSADVTLKPTSPTRNTIYSQGDDIPELGGVRHSATSTADHAAFYNEDAATKTFSIDVNGNIIDREVSYIYSASQNDLALDADARTFRIKVTAPSSITGIAGGVANREIQIVNTGTETITLTDEDALSTAANRFTFGADFSLPPNCTIGLRYDGTTSRWLATAIADPSGASGNYVLRTPTTNAESTVQIDGATLTNKTLTVKGYASQTGSLLSVQDSTGFEMVDVTVQGTLEMRPTAAMMVYGRSSEPALSATPLIDIKQNGIISLGGMKLEMRADGTEIHGFNGSTGTIPGGASFSGNILGPAVITSSDVTVTGYMKTIYVNTAAATRIVTLPAHANGFEVGVYKTSGANSLLVKNSLGVLLQAYTSAGDGALFQSVSGTWVWK